MTILIIAEHDNQQLDSVNYRTLTAARELTGDIDVLLVGDVSEMLVTAARQLPHIHRVYCASAAVYAAQLPENTAPLIATLAKSYDYVLMAATTTAKNILPRVAALLDISMLADVVQIVSADTFVRPIYAGNALATIKSHEKIKLLTIRATGFAAAAAASSSVTLAPLETMDTQLTAQRVQFISTENHVSARPSLSAARIVISGGRGLKSAENFKLLEGLADQLGAAIGASRAAVDANFAPNDWQVGQTGKIVAPDLYIAIGISGAIQHLAGMKDSKVIVAINTDPDAPIFSIADFGLVGDFLKILPEFRVALGETEQTQG